MAAHSAHRPVGNNSDLYPRWFGARALLRYHRNPYSDEVTREIQTGFYGRPLDPRQPSDPTARESFVYPLYVVFLIAPTVNLSFVTVQAFARWFLLCVLGASVPLWMYAVGFRTRCTFLLSGILLALSSYPAVLEFHMQNLAVLAIFFLAAAAALVVRKYYLLAGATLALATIKPEASWLVIAWFLLWSISDYGARKRLLWSFLATMAVLIGAAEALLPHWIGWFLGAVREYPVYGSDPNFFQIFLPKPLATLAGIVLLGVVLVLWLRWRKAAPGSSGFGWALAWAAVATLAILPKLAAYNQPLLIPALLVLIAQSESQLNLVARALRKGAFACQIWQWVTASVLSLCSLVFPISRLMGASQWPLLTFLALPPLTLLAVVLCTFSTRESASYER